MPTFLPRLAQHPLARKLAFFAPYFAGYDVDVVTQSPGRSQGNTLAALDYSNKRGRVMRTKDISGDGRLYGTAGKRWSPLFNVSNELTIAVSCIPRDMPTYTEIVTLPDTATWGGHYAHFNLESPAANNTVKINMSTTGPSDGIASGVGPDGVSSAFWHPSNRASCYGIPIIVSISAWRSGDSWYATFFKNGLWWSDSAAFPTYSNILPPTTYQPLNVGGIPAESNGFKADFSWVAIWSRRLTKPEHASLSFAMEHLVLQRGMDIRTKFYSIPAAAPTFNPAWARNSNIILQPGVLA